MGLVAGLVVGLVALATRWTGRPGPPPAALCRAVVADPDGDGELRAELTPDRTATAALVVGLADQRGLPARAATIAVATAIQESGLRDLDYGDRDSLGLFQQRPSQGWGTPEQVSDPLYATSAFYDALVQVDGYTGLDITDAAQQVQRSGFPEAYADHEGEGRALASSLYGLSPASLTCELPAVDRAGGDADRPAPDAAAAAVVADLRAWTRPGWQASAVEAADPPTEDGDGAGGPGGDGPARAVVLLDVTASAEPGRAAWALAHSAVALAERHGVVRVEVEGLVWDRSVPGGAWLDGAKDVIEGGDGPSTGGTVPGDGLVRITTG